MKDNEEKTMQQYHTTLTERGQVTLPVEIRKRLGVKPKDKVTFEVEGDDIRIVPSRFTVESVRGSVPALAQPRSLEEIFDIAGEEHARHVIDEMTNR
jgi:AbrB family looped-hinge helix DNA binding protein